MSKIMIAVVSLMLVSVVVIAFGGQVAGGIEQMLLSLHGQQGSHGSHGAGHTKDSDAEQARSRALRDGWPDTPVGLVASGWVEAFSEGEDAMREFIENNQTEASLAERSMDKRIETYHMLHDRFGSLMFGSIVESNPEELTVAVLAEDASSNRFVFTVEEEPPHKLMMVRVFAQGHGHGGNPGTH